MGKFGEQLAGGAIDAAKGIVNTGMGLLLQRGQDKRQLNMSRKLQRMQMEGDKEMTNYNFQKQMEMWQKTGYGAQVKQIKEAGLNPGLLYGMGGAGGQTANVDTGQTNTGNAPTGGGEIQSMLGMGIQRELLAAQKDLITAQAENVRADTANKPTIGKNIEASTGSLLQGIENQKAQQELTEVQTSIANIEDYIKGKTQNLQVSLMMKVVQSAEHTMNILENEQLISDETKQQKIDLVKLQVVTEYLKAIKTQAETAEIGQQIEKLINDMKVANQTVDIQKGKLALETAIADGTIINWKGGALDVVKRIVGSWIAKK